MKVSSMRVVQRLLTVVVCAAAASSCGDVARQGRSPVYVIIDSLQAARGGESEKFLGTLLSDVVTDGNAVFNDTGQAVLELAPKDITALPAPTTNNQVTINRYRVDYRRADGRNRAGIDVPYGFDGAVTGTIPASGKLTVVFEIVRHAAKEQSPLVDLAANNNIISTIADVTFYGRDQVGNDVSVTGSISIDFGDFAG